MLRDRLITSADFRTGGEEVWPLMNVASYVWVLVLADDSWRV